METVLRRPNNYGKAILSLHTRSAITPPALALTSALPYSVPMRIYREFLFEAAHFLPSAPPGHPNSRIHGHSFRTRVLIDGEPDAETGVVFHFDELSAAMEDARDALDHRLLNEVEGLDQPTLECIAIWLWSRLANRVPGLAQIEIHRDSCHEGCIYQGPETGKNSKQQAAE